MNYAKLIAGLSLYSCSMIASELPVDNSRIGKTHFIVNDVNIPVRTAPPLKRIYELAERNDPAKESACALFAPDDNVRDALIKLIDDEKEAIAIAVFIITDNAIAQALIQAKKRGVDIQLIVDVGCLKDKASKIPLLSGHDCTIYLYDPTIGAPQRTNSLMHHKFALFKNNKGTPVVWTGSYNFTKAASENNRENVMIIKKKNLYDQYLHQFNELKNKSYKYARRTVIG